MKPQFDAHTSLVADLIAFWWTPLFVIVFLAIVTYALWPNNRATFDEAARLPLRED
jgi:cytochrome c oxidase cbb3-type subunit 4